MNNNPLKQYFRRPSIYIKLPSGGKCYDQSIIDLPENGEIAVFPMTAIDEITSRTPDAVFNGHAVVDIIKSCIPCIKDPWKINTIDLDAIMVAMRVASNGEEMDIISNCPACGNEGKYGINLVQLLNDKHNIDYEKTLKVRDLTIKFKPLTYAETNNNSMAQYEVQKMLAMLEEVEDGPEKVKQSKDALVRLNKLTSGIVSTTIDSITTPETTVTEKEYIEEFLENCDRQTNNAIKDYSIKLRNENQMRPLRIKCVECQHEYEQSLILNITDFFG